MLHRITAGGGRSSVWKAGEQMAEWFLKNAGFKILRRNFKTPFGEIDLVCLDKDIIVFVEVKTRISNDFGPPSLAVNDAKKRTIVKNAVYYLKRFRLLDTDARIDVVSINLSGEGRFEKLEHIKSAVWIE